MVSSVTIYVSPETKKALFELKQFGEDYDAIIIRLMKEAEAGRKK